MLDLCVNEQDYRRTIKLLDIKFRKTDSIWNQLFQKMIIVEVRLSRIVWVGKKITAKIRRYWLKQTVKSSNLRLGCDIWNNTDNCKMCDGSRIASNC